jgi:hypothetical protein
MGKHHKLLAIVVMLFAILTIGDMVYVALNKSTTPPPKPLKQINVAAEEPLEKVETEEDIVSPDTKATLRVKNKENTNGTIHQTFSFFTEKDTTPLIILEQDSSKDSLVTVPFNTFSPNNKYVFLKVESTHPSHLVLRTDSENIAKDIKYADIEDRFYAQHPEFVITDVTGWGGYTLIVVNTNDREGKIGPSWWFDASSLSFIRLSTRFN